MDHLSPYKMAKLINDAFLISYNPLSTTNKIEIDHQESPIQVSEYDTFIKLKSLNSNKRSGPDKIAPWFLKHFAEVLAYPVSFLLNCSFRAEKLPKQ